jgi:hypothetical protein
MVRSTVAVSRILCGSVGGDGDRLRAVAHAAEETGTMAKKYTAQCACGSVKFEFDTDPRA